MSWNQFRSLTCLGMQLHQLPQVLPDIPPALGTFHCSRRFFVHQDTASRTKPLTAETVAFIGKSEVLRLFSLTHEPRVQPLRHELRQLHLSALTAEHATLHFQRITTLRTVHFKRFYRRLAKPGELASLAELDIPSRIPGDECWSDAVKESC